MDREPLAARIGSRYVRNSMFVGLAIAAFILVLPDREKVESLLRLIERHPLQALICVVVGPLIGHIVGAWAGKRILLEGRNAKLVSLTAGFVCVWATTFLFSLVGFFEEGLQGSHLGNAISDYILNPLVAVTYVGGLFVIPTAFIVAALFERAIRKHFPA